MPICRLDNSIERKIIGTFQFPLGVYPIENLEPKAGYVMEFEPADVDEGGGDKEEWPDRYMFDIVISAQRLEPLCRRLLSLLPGRIYPIVDLLGRDAYREVDPYISYELLGVDRMMDAMRRFRPFFFEDGLCGFGATCDEPFIYFFVDEHKIVTVRVEPNLKETVEKILESFDLEQVTDPAGADSAAHEHRSVLLMPPDEPQVLGPDEIVEFLRDEWRMLLNIDPETNVDEEGRELGVTPWRCIVRCDPPAPGDGPEETPPTDKPAPGSSPPPGRAVMGPLVVVPPSAAGSRPEPPTSRYAEIILEADRLRVAEETAFDAVDMLSEKSEETWEDVVIVAADRLEPEDFAKVIAEQVKGAVGPTAKTAGKPANKNKTSTGPSPERARPNLPRPDKSPENKGDPHSNVSEDADPDSSSEEPVEPPEGPPGVLHRARWLDSGGGR